MTNDTEIQALGRAIAVERRARFIDFRGKRTTFSRFMHQMSDRLAKRYPADGCWSTMRGLFNQYQNLDLASRIAVLHRAEAMITELSRRDQDAERAGPAATRPATPAGMPPQGKVVGSKAGGSGHAIKSGGTAKAAGQPERGREKDLGKASGPQARPKAAAATKTEAAGQSYAQAPAPDQSRVREAAAASQADDSKKPAVLGAHGQPDTIDVQYVKGVGPRLKELLENLGVFSAADLIQHYPRHHLDFNNHLKIKDIEPGLEVTVFGEIKSVSAFTSKKGLGVVSISINDKTGTLVITRFVAGKSNKYMLDRYKDQYPRGAFVMASGVAQRDKYGNRMTLKNAEIEILSHGFESDEDPASLHAGRMVPVYPLTEGLGLRALRRIIHNALESYVDKMPDCLPDAIRIENDLYSRRQALWGIHFPKDEQDKDEARRRLAFDELFTLQLQLALRRHAIKSQSEALALPVVTGGLIERFQAALPFTLTGAQLRVFNEIAGDLAATAPMHRLVQGDVGSGKTCVAAMACLVAIENGYQAAVMAPTEILAEQHYRQFQRWLTPLGLRVGLFLGKQGVKERRQEQQALVSGQVHVAVGTHALIQDDIEFARLGLIVIDEQHRFGVKQRAQLKAKGVNPELLTMTATPIPRTLSLSLHGDLDVSEIDELPPGRKPILTKVMTPGQKQKLTDFISEQIAAGRQAYIVFPLIEESESLSAKAATIEYEKLKSGVFKHLRLALMHGKLKPQEKEKVMDEFRQGQYDILISTTVIEVGVDVPNSTVMVIENADRFGLAQLHQLRGRVGRGGEQSYCFLVASGGSPTTRQRLAIMEQTNDGFVVAQKDLELRGPGEFLGTRQSGLPDMLLADVVNDAGLLEAARHAALDLVKSDPELKRFPVLKELIARRTQSESADLLTAG